jgi:CRISPR-associated endonuclease/helicase Cas3
MTGELIVEEFADFFRCINAWGRADRWASAKQGPEPFPWQAQLLRDWVSGAKGWPEILDLPTSSGKTAALDIAVFHLAMDADKGAERKAPVRIAFVVDRRLIVDDAYQRAKRIQDALADAARNTDAPEIVCRVAERLGRLAERSERPLLARRLRGGLPREEDWARTPSQPTILCSTVDQVGSRLLFRGYGVSNSMKPVHAGLLGSDCLILLDEAHLSRPFHETLAAVERHRGTSERPAAAPFKVAFLTATPGEEPGTRFGLGLKDREHPILRPRLEAPKPARLVETREKSGQPIEDQRAEAVEREVAAALERLSGADDLDTQPIIGVVVNRVLRARRIFQRLRDVYSPPDECRPPRCDVLLVIGPAREADCTALAADLDPIKTGANEARRQLRRPRIVVATQTVEAGVDLDFDALITEIAPLDALKQRFGRLNRAGRPFVAYAAILAYREDVRPSKGGDPVYGLAAAATWNALQQLAKDRANDSISVDFGISASGTLPWIGEILPKQIEAGGLLASRPDAPVLMPAYVDLWSQTSPVPAADPGISLFLHGPDRSPATVQIVWRADVREVDLREAQTQSQARRRLLELFAAIPPRPAEAIEISLTAARRWLQFPSAERNDAETDFADVPQPDREAEFESHLGRSAFRWAGPDSDRSGSVHARRLRPNDLIVVPADYGGCDEFGWHPASRNPVRDVADQAAAPFAARRYALRLTPELIRTAARPGEDDAAVAERDRAYAISDSLAEVIANWRDALGRHRARDLVNAMRALIPPHDTDEGLALLENPRHGRLQAIFPYGEDEEGRARGLVLLAPKGVRGDRLPDEELAGGIPATEDDWQGSLSGDVQTLRQHSEDVRKHAALFVGRAGLNETASDVARAAYLHDAGKADPRFQALLYGGDWFAVNERKILAKSVPGVGPDAVAKAGLPEHWRHEALSVRIAREHPLFDEAHDKELVLWLIGVHHGYGRPLFPHADPRDDRDRDLAHIEGERFRLEKGAGPQSLAFSVDGWDWAQIFDRLKRRYGVWELARMEAIVRLADHRASEAAVQDLAP